MIYVYKDPSWKLMVEKKISIGNLIQSNFANINDIVSLHCDSN